MSRWVTSVIIYKGSNNEEHVTELSDYGHNVYTFNADAMSEMFFWVGWLLYMRLRDSCTGLLIALR